MDVGEAAANLQLQEDELCALQSIYGEDALAATDARSWRTAVPAPDGPHLVLAFHLPESYPSAAPPLFQLDSSYLPGDVSEQLATELEAAFLPGEPCLFNWIEHLRTRWEELAPQKQQDPEQQQEDGAQAGTTEDSAGAAAELLQQVSLGEAGLAGPLNGARLAAQLAADEVADTIVHGEPFTERRSTFQAHLAPVHNLQQVEAVMEILLQNNKIRAATHNIMAYRIEQPERGTFQQDCDDDGEDAAGGRLLHLLQMVDARNVVVVVSRWFGGVLLGPARFAFINNTARQLLDACGYVGGGDKGPGGGGGSKGKGKGKGGVKK